MSERGSFVTEYIYCDKCFEAVKKILLSDDKALIDAAGREDVMAIARYKGWEMGAPRYVLESIANTLINRGSGFPKPR